jgi:hypothetical protein
VDRSDFVCACLCAWHVRVFPPAPPCVKLIAAAAAAAADNIWAIKSFVVRNFGAEPAQVDAQLEIDDKFDYVE